MRGILILIKGLGRGGAEQLLASSAPYLDRESFRYEFAYLLPWKNALVPNIEANGFTVTCLEGGSGLGWVRRLKGIVEPRDIDLVHVHSPYPAIYARTALRRVGLVYTEHNLWSRYHRATYWGNLLTFNRNDHVFAVSDEVRACISYPKALRLRRMPPVETLHHGLDLAAIANVKDNGVRGELGIPKEVPVVGTVANFKPHKGHGDLLQAAAEVKREVPDVRFVLVGLGPLEEPMRRRAAELGLDGSVIFAGFREDALRVVSSFDVFASASHHEGLPIAMVESMALGVPPVVTRVGGVPEVVTEGKDGVLVPPHDPSSLARAIVSVLEDGDRRRELGEAARRRGYEFDIRNAVSRTEEIYTEVLR